MSIVGSNSEGLSAFVDRLKTRGVASKNPAAGLHKNELFIEYKRSKINTKRGQVWYHALIKYYNSDGQSREATSKFLIAIKQEKLLGTEKVKMELNKIVAEKLRLLLDFKEVNDVG